MESCDAFNKQYSMDESCIGISYVPSWINGANNCFVKSVIGDGKIQPWYVDSALLGSSAGPSSPARSSSESFPTSTLSVQSVVAAALPAPSSSPSSSLQISSISSTSALLVSSSSTPLVFSSAGASTTMDGGPSIKYALGNSVIAPMPGSSTLHGTSSNEPTDKYIKWSNPPNLKLSSNYLTKSINGDLSTQYGLSPDTGVLEVNETTKPLLSDLKHKPHLSRDGGKGGYLNGHKVFLFCDTGSYTPASADQKGNFLGFVSSSAAIDKGMNAASGKALTIQDGIGQWGDDVGRMRGFSPMTSGEQSYNLAMQGNGQRYAIWPESSILPFNQTHALLYAPIIFDDVDMTTKAAKFTYTGTTLLVLSIPGEGGPLALRLVDKLFEQDEVEWGTIGGIRSYGPSGMGGNDGRVYLFGNVQGGLLAARVDAGEITNRDSVSSSPNRPPEVSKLTSFNSTSTGMGSRGIRACSLCPHKLTSSRVLSWMGISFIPHVTSPSSLSTSIRTPTIPFISATWRQIPPSFHQARQGVTRPVTSPKRCLSTSGLLKRFSTMLHQGRLESTSTPEECIRATLTRTTSRMVGRKCCLAGPFQPAAIRQRRTASTPTSQRISSGTKQKIAPPVNDGDS